MADGGWPMAEMSERYAPEQNNQPQSKKGTPRMAKYQHFEELPVWQSAKKLYNLVLDLLEEPGVPLTPGFRNQLDRAALSVSNNIAEGFERSTTAELQSFIAIARGSAGEVRSMMAVVHDRPKLKKYVAALHNIRALAESCARQLTGWSGSIEKLPFEGKRHLPEKERTSRQVRQQATDFRLNFLRGLKPSHPLYNSSEARAARGERVE
jgi:four helix bundle protein